MHLSTCDYAHKLYYVVEAVCKESLLQNIWVLCVCFSIIFFRWECKSKITKNNWCWKCIITNTKTDGNKNALMQDTLNKGLGTDLFQVNISYMQHQEISIPFCWIIINIIIQASTFNTFNCSKLYKHRFEIHFSNYEPLKIVKCHAMRSFAMWDVYLASAFHELCKIQAHLKVRASLAYKKNETHLDPSIWKCFFNEPPMVKTPYTQSACLSWYMLLTLILT